MILTFLLFNTDMVLITARGISDPVFMHLSRTLTICELVQLKNVSKTFSKLVSENSAITAHVRREDNSMDWYYPCYILTRVYGYEIPHYHRDAVPGLWFGAHRLSGVFHTLPSYSHFLPRRASHYPQDVHASVEGLLLLLLEKPDPSKWKPLVVTNPVTREWRLLPAPDCATLGLSSWNYDTFQLYMIADDKTTYKVIIIHKGSLCVYKSTTNAWRSHILSAELPFGVRYRTRIKYYGPSSAVVNGRIGFAQLEYDDDAEPKYEVRTNLNLLTRGQVRVYEVDDEAGRSKPCVQYKLQDYFPSDLYRRYRDYGFRIGSYQVGIVECMGCMHALIPAWLDISKSIDEEFRQFHELAGPTCLRYTDYGIQKLRFYILRLEGSVGRPFGTLLIEDGRSNNNNMDYHLQNPPLNARSCSPYSYRCVARGSVIWVTLDDYMLQYDVLSGRSKTEILPRTSFYQLPTEQNVAFTPSLFATP